jgi:hypothetical protein
MAKRGLANTVGSRYPTRQSPMTIRQRHRRLGQASIAVPTEPREHGMDEARFRALEARIDALEGEIKRARNDIQWAIGLMFVVPVGLLIILRVWS